jgi:hypothetical protein
MELNYLDCKDVRTQSDAFLHFMQMLDTQMVDSVLKEDRTYQDLEKPEFMKALSKALDSFTEEGYTHLRCFSGKCGSKKCHYECSGVRFVGDTSSSYMDLIVLVKEGEVQDVFECTSFYCDDGPVEVKKRVWIEGFDFL